MKPGSGDKTATKVYPFIDLTVDCPLCGATESHRRFKANLFAERGRDIDLRPLQYVTTVKGLGDYHPPLYYVWHCSQCLFAAGYQFYEEPFKDCGMSETKIKGRISEARSKVPHTKKFLEKLGREVEAPVLDYFQAMKLHLLAIFNLTIDDTLASNNSMNLGRYYLRTAWLFHEIQEDREKKEAFRSKVASLTQWLKEDWKDVPEDETMAAEKAVKQFSEALVGSYAIKTPLDQVELSLLIARIHMKLGDIPQARKYLQTGREGARKSVENINEQLRGSSDNGSPLSEKKQTELRGMSRKLEAVVDHAQNVFEDIRAEWEGEQIERANEIIAKHQGKKADALREILLENQIDEFVANKLISRMKKKSKKGLLGLFG